MKLLKKNIKILAGVLISAAFMYLALSKVDYGRMLQEFGAVNYFYVLPAVLVIFLSYWLRSLRWRYLMDPIKRVHTGSLFSALLIGYMANSFLPAHLGELIRAYIIGKRENLSSSMVFGTIIVERILDILSLVLLMGITILIFPFPPWVRVSGYLLLGGAVGLSAVLVLMKIYRSRSLAILSKLTGWLPERVRDRITGLFSSLLDGIVPLKRSSHYFIVLVLTLVIWLCYAGSFQIVFYSFNFAALSSLPWTAALVLLVITTISVVVPSSPGYVGTYHFLCQLSLGFFGISETTSLSYAFIMHGINFFPIIIVGLLLVSLTKLSLKNLQKESARQFEGQR
ncbi:MAG: flippase-like domain-containing protein [bacterium]|nr:flippase-like domain-containing protein [bacterium]